ncbi:hypothetical protein [uncultured Amphritea sp.]|uniref:hypothetical protein n=1 Tax=uncultured Amphritea sp. TaxID=981605 RepID=UPI002617E450|nr:hypothetical protein [uncultured Amphritea sp.]
MSGGGSSDNKIKDTPEQKYLAQVAAEQWNFAQENLAPLQQAYMDSVETMDSPERKSFIQGKVNTNTQAAVSGAINGTVAGGESAGIDPSSGRFKLGITEGTTNAASAGGNIASQALFEQDTAKAGGLSNIVAMGSGQESRAVAGLSDISSLSGQNARSDAYNEFNKNSANLQLLGNVAGMGTAYYANNAGGVNMQGRDKPLYNNSTFVSNM